MCIYSIVHVHNYEHCTLPCRNVMYLSRSFTLVASELTKSSCGVCDDSMPKTSIYMYVYTYTHVHVYSSSVACIFAPDYRTRKVTLMQR